ncbi:MAG: hypothetical protein E7481_05075 [Ruminococcaceae bacterium]|nr:hypothetical protein [Oscillospiraceae bacterium]
MNNRDTFGSTPELARTSSSSDNSISDNIGRSSSETVQNDEQNGKTVLRKDILDMNEDELRTRVSELEQQNQNLAKSMYEGVIAPSKTKMLNIAKNLVNKYGSKYPSSSLAKGLFDRLVESDILSKYQNSPIEEIQRELKTALKNKYGDGKGVYIGHKKIEINNTSRKEFGSSKYSRRLYSEDQDVLKDKYLSLFNADEVLKASQNYVNEAPKHVRKDNIVDFGRGNVYIKVGDNLYNADVVVGYTSNNNMVFYDLVGLKSQNNENTSKSSLDGRKTTEDGNSLMYINSISDNIGRSETEPVQNDEQSGKTALRKDILEMNEDELRTRVSELEQQNQNLAKSMYEGVIAPSKTKMLNIAKNLINKYGSKYPSSSLAKGLFDRLVEIDTGFDRNGKKLNQWEIERNLKNTLRPVIQEAIEVDRERYDELSEVRKEIRSLELSPE